MRFNILTIFPEIFPAYLKTSILGRAQKDKLIEIGVHNIRDYTEDKHNTVDDTPYGGGAGMILKIEPIDQALKKIRDSKYSTSKQLRNTKYEIRNTRTVVLSAKGKQFDQHKAEEFAQLDQLVLICGRYEGIDQRVTDHLADEELSIGPYVLNGGEVAAMTIIEAVSRLVPGVLGNPGSLIEESFSNRLPRAASSRSFARRGEAQSNSSEQSGEYPQYTKPEKYKGWKVPSILLSGDHAKIKKWREEQQEIE